MPGGDRTGPMGMGPMTGRAAGYCAGFGVPGFANRGLGFGRGWFGRGRGGGRGWRNLFYATGLTGWQRAGYPGRVCWPGWFFGAPYLGAGLAGAAGREQEVEFLKRQADYLAGVLEEIKKRLDDLQAKPQQQD